MVAAKQTRDVPWGTSAESYERKRDRQGAQNKQASEKARDIGELPKVVNPKRRAKALKDPHYFYETYFPRRFTLKMSADQRASIDELERISTEGGVKAYAAPRGDGKTTRAECAAIRAICKGKRRFIAVIGATKAAADDILSSIKGEFETNELLFEDFPEICHPIRMLEGIAQRSKAQTYQGELTRMRWSGTMLVLPTMPNSPASGVVVCVRGITGQIRGMKYRRPDGETIRPDLAIVDDPQTKRSAHSPHQCKRRLEIIRGDILGLAGPGKKIACFVPCTVITKGDLADQILDPEKFPMFQGTRTQLVYEFPTDLKLWDEYAELRRAGQRRRDLRAANAFYKKHRKAMDAGARVAWSERFDEDELSAIQNAMNLKIDKPDAFDAEYQNQPRDEEAEEEKLLTADQIGVKVTALARFVVPLSATVLTAFIDCQKRLLYWAVCAWSPEFTGSCIGYGAWPEQPRRYFTYREAHPTIPQRFPAAGELGAIRGALDMLIEELASREFTREDGLKLRIGRIIIDAGNWADVVYQCCRESKHAAILLPSKGKGIGPAKAPISEWKRHEGQLVGEEWLLGRVENKRAVRLLTYDTNYWKTRMHSGLATAAGDRGAFSLHGPHGTNHDMLAAHVAAETREKTFGQGRTVYVYTLRPEKPDNHLGDCLVGNGVAASVMGCRLVGKPLAGPKSKPKPRSRPRVTPLQC